MCRLLYVQSENEFDINYHLEKFAEICKNSKENQGHGWGIAYYQNGQWNYYKNIDPIWVTYQNNFGKSKRIVVHARSAFQDKDIFIENNMPFYDDKSIFVFNGELRGVKINSQGRIGAEKIFNFIKKFDKGDIFFAFKKAKDIIIKQTDYIRAMNIILLDDKKTYICSLFNEDKEYFTMHKKVVDDTIIICSEVYNGETNWQSIENNFIGEII